MCLLSRNDYILASGMMALQEPWCVLDQSKAFSYNITSGDDYKGQRKWRMRVTTRGIGWSWGINEEGTREILLR